MSDQFLPQRTRDPGYLQAQAGHLRMLAYRTRNPDRKMKLRRMADELDAQARAAENTAVSLLREHRLQGAL